MPEAADDPESVLKFWFGDIDAKSGCEASLRARWFRPDPDFDALVRDRFGALLEAARRGELDAWQATPRGRLALIVLLDQFNRNVYRGTEDMFSSDHKALELAERGLERGDERGLQSEERMFFYMPFMHSEALANQERCVALFQALAKSAPSELAPRLREALRYAEQHRDIVKRFGRFPTRNSTLERTSTGEELAFLTAPDSEF